MVGAVLVHGVVGHFAEAPGLVVDEALEGVEVGAVEVAEPFGFPEGVVAGAAEDGVGVVEPGGQREDEGFGVEGVGAEDVGVCLGIGGRGKRFDFAFEAGLHDDGEVLVVAQAEVFSEGAGRVHFVGVAVDDGFDLVFEERVVEGFDGDKPLVAAGFEAGKRGASEPGGWALADEEPGFCAQARGDVEERRPEHVDEEDVGIKGFERGGQLAGAGECGAFEGGHVDGQGGEVGWGLDVAGDAGAEDVEVAGVAGAA